LDERISIRTEFQSLGLDSILNQIKVEETKAEVQAQIDTYEQDIVQDEEEFADRVSANKKVNFKDPKELFMLLMDHIKDQGHIYNPFFDVMRQLLVLPTDKSKGTQIY